MPRSIVLAVDVEPDARADAGVGWGGTTAALRELESLRPRLEEATQRRVCFNWFLRFDPQIEAAWGREDWLRATLPGFLERLEESGDLAGIHPHLWRLDERRGSWFNDFADDAWGGLCLRSSIEGFESVLGRRPVACRFGDRWISQELVSAMRAEGILYDLTVEPGAPSEPLSDDPHATGWLPDYRRAPRVPYRPSADDFLVPDEEEQAGRGLWMVPLSTTLARWTQRVRFPYVTRASWSANLVLRPRRLWGHLATEIDRATTEPLVVVFRSGDVVNPRYLANLQRITERLATYPGLQECSFLRVDEAMELHGAPRAREPRV